MCLYACVYMYKILLKTWSVKKNESKAIALADVGPSTGLADLEPSSPVAVSWPERSWGLVQMPGSRLAPHLFLTLATFLCTWEIEGIEGRVLTEWVSGRLCPL